MFSKTNYLITSVLILIVAVLAAMFISYQQKKTYFNWNAINPKLRPLLESFDTLKSYNDAQAFKAKFEIWRICETEDLEVLLRHPNDRYRALAKEGNIIASDFDFSEIINSLDAESLMIDFSYGEGCVLHSIHWSEYLVQHILGLSDSIANLLYPKSTQNLTSDQKDSILSTYRRIKQLDRH